jgi:perosamine synthetase
MTIDKKNLDKISFKLKQFFLNKSKRLHDPIFFGNEKKYLLNCINTGFVSSVGKFVDNFEHKICKITKSKYSIATSSGTAALHLALHNYEINENDEVLLPSFTYVATANAVKYCNATPNFVDIEKTNFGVCPKRLEIYLKKIVKKRGNKSFNKFSKKRIKALIVVHVYGLPCKIYEIKKICKKFNIILIEDAAEAVGSYYKGKHLGTFGDIGILSFNGNKTLTTGAGGSIITNNRNVAKKLKHLSTHAKLKKRYDHFHDYVGFNYRMNNLSAAVGCAQIENLKKILIAKRKNFQSYYDLFKDFKGIKLIKEPVGSKINYWLIIAIFSSKKTRDKFSNLLNKKGYGVRYTWRPLHTLKVFKNCPSDKINNSLDVFNRTINLPSSPSLSLRVK